MGGAPTPSPIPRRPSTMTRRRSSKIRRKRALSSPASRSAARAAHWTNSFVEMKKLPCIAVSAGMKARGAPRGHRVRPVLEGVGLLYRDVDRLALRELHELGIAGVVRVGEDHLVAAVE